MDRPANATVQPNANVTSPAHNALARKLAASSMVLLQNKGDALPFSTSTFTSTSVDASSVDRNHENTKSNSNTGGSSNSTINAGGSSGLKTFVLFGNQAVHPIVGGHGPPVSGINMVLLENAIGSTTLAMT
jgi:beta-glucosidase-like glycosyl hydrolase